MSSSREVAASSLRMSVVSGLSGATATEGPEVLRRMVLLLMLKKPNLKGLCEISRWQTVPLDQGGQVVHALSSWNSHRDQLPVSTLLRCKGSRTPMEAVCRSVSNRVRAGVHQTNPNSGYRSKYEKEGGEVIWMLV